jgi:metallo-beta-lactamase class B
MMKLLNFCSIVVASAVSLGVVLAAMGAGQSRRDAVDSHVEAARRAAGSEFLPVFDSLCGPLTAVVGAPASAPAQAARKEAGPPPRNQWHVDPMKVFDNLYYLGQSEYTAWAITTSAGIIVVDPLFE